MVRNLILLGAFAAVGVSGATNEVPRKGSSTKPVITTRGATTAPRGLPRAASGQRKSGAEAAESVAGVKKRRQPTEASGNKGGLVEDMPSESELPELVRTLHLAIYHGKSIHVNWGARSQRWAKAELRKLKDMWDEANSIEQHKMNLVDAVIAGSVSKDALDGQLPIVVNRLSQLRNEYRNLPLAAIVAMALKNTLPSVEEALTNEETALASLFTPQAILGACRSIISSSYPAASSSYPASAVSFAAVRVIGSSLVDFDSEKTDQALESVLRALKREEVTGIMSRILDLMGRNEPKLMKLSTDSTKLDTDSTKLDTDSTKLPRGGQSEDGLEGDSLHPSESEETRHCSGETRYRSGETRYCSGETRYYSPLAVQYVQMYLAFDYVASDVDGPLNLSLEVLEGLLAGKDETHTAFLRRLGPWGTDRLKARIAIMRSTEGHDAISELYPLSKNVSGRELTNMVKYNAELLQRGAVDSHLASELITRIVPYDPLDRYRVKLIEGAWKRLQNDCRVQQAAAKVEPHIIYWKGVDAARKAILECPWVERSWKTLNLVDHEVDPKIPYGVTSDHIRQACVELGHEFHVKNAEKHKRFYRYLAQHKFNYL